MDTSFDVLPEPTRAETTDPRIPPREQVVTRSLMERWNRECPDKVFVKFADDGEAWTYREFRQLVLQTAVGLQRLSAWNIAASSAFILSARHSLTSARPSSSIRRRIRSPIIVSLPIVVLLVQTNIVTPARSRSRHSSTMRSISSAQVGTSSIRPTTCPAHTSPPCGSPASSAARPRAPATSGFTSS